MSSLSPRAARPFSLSLLSLGFLLGGLLTACQGTAPAPVPAPGPYATDADGRWSDPPAATSADPYAGGRQYPWRSPVVQGAPSGLSAQGLSGENYLSDLTWTQATSGWGPVEKNLSNGEQGLGDGRTLTIGGQTFARGLGVHASSSVTYALGGACSTLNAMIGVDDEVGANGSVVFQVLVDGVKVFDSGRLTGADAARSISVPVSGAGQLTLLVSDAGDNNYYDHADWADAKLSCAAPAVPITYLSDVPWTQATNGWGPVERDLSNGDKAQGDGRTISLRGVTYRKGLGAHAGTSASDISGSVVQYDLRANTCTQFQTVLGVDDEVGNGRGSVVFQVYGVSAGQRTKLFDSGVLRGTDAARPLSVNLQGYAFMELAVLNGGDNNYYDHADWADARFDCAAPPAPAANTFTYSAIAPQPVGVAEAQGRMVNGKLYVFGGFDKLKSCCTPTDRANVYDPATNTWTAFPNMPERGGTHMGMTVSGQYVYYAGGFLANSTWTGQVYGSRAVWQVDTVTGTYSRLPDLPYPSSAGALEYLQGTLHYFGGTSTDRLTDLGTHYVLNLSNLSGGWTRAADLPVPRHHMGAAVLNGRIYAIGGQQGHDAALVTRPEVTAYDPATNTWTALAPLPRARSHISNSTFVQQGRIVVVGGETANGVLIADVSAYDPATNTWVALTSLPQGTMSAVAGSLGGSFIVTGGNSVSTNQTAQGWRASPQ